MMRAMRAAVIGLGAALILAGAAGAQGLPGGASALNETHGDWSVGCTVSGAVRCAISQNQVNNENRQRVLAIELVPTEGGAEAQGLLVLPFGLRLQAGVALAVDETTAVPAGRFSTCLPAGCMVPLAFDSPTLTTLREGEALNVKATAEDSGREVAFSVSLAGFASALRRAAELTDGG